MRFVTQLADQLGQGFNHRRLVEARKWICTTTTTRSDHRSQAFKLPNQTQEPWQFSAFARGSGIINSL